jgi:hypothetical protein
MFGTPLNLPGEVLEKPGSGGETERPAGLPVRPRLYAEAVKGPAGQIGATRYMYVRRGPGAGPLAPHFDGPYEVLERTDKVFKLQIGGRVESVSADRLSRTWGYACLSQRARHGRVIRPGRADMGSLLSILRSLGGAWCRGSGEI